MTEMEEQDLQPYSTETTERVRVRPRGSNGQQREDEDETRMGGPARPEPPRGKRGVVLVAVILGIAIAVGATAFLRYAATYESTDDAQVEAHLVGVSARIQGTVTGVYAEENQSIQAGQLLVAIDPRDFEVAVDQSRAQVTQAQADIQAENPHVPMTQTSNQTSISNTQAEVANAEAAVAGAESQYAAAQARLLETQANNAKAQADVARYGALVQKDEVPREQYDQVIATAKAQAAAVDSAAASADAARKVVDQRRAQLAQARSQLNQAASNAPRQVAISRATLEARVAAEQAARARMEQTLLNLSYTKVVAPAGGVISKRNVEVGTTVAAGQQLFTISQLDDLWVTANFKETQLRHMHPGLRATLYVDAYGKDFNGYVESMPGASGAITSLLPPENATGNYVKVVQRLPVRIRFDKNQPGLERLRPGMSVEPKVWLQ
jgi:membrane fusion protein (multidrug efflux system)